MAVKEIIPNTNISVDDIRDTLNANGGSVSQPSTFFTTAAKINPWSKKKPSNFTEDFCQDFDKNRSDYREGWWKGTDGMCGFTIPWYKTYIEAVNNTNGGMNGWTYNLPKLKFRLGDFAGYYPKASPIIKDFSVPKYASKQEGTIIMTAFMHTDTSPIELSFADFTELGKCYFGVCITKENKSYRVTSESTIGSGGSIVTLNSSLLDTGSWSACPFLSSKQITQSGADPSSAMYYAIPNMNKVSFEVRESMLVININATRGTKWVNGDIYFGITYKITVTSYYSGQRILNNNKLYIRNKTKEFDDPMLTYEMEIPLDDVTVAGDGEKTVTHEGFAIVEDLINLYNNCKVWVSLDDGKFVKGTIPLEEGNVPEEPIEESET